MTWPPELPPSNRTNLSPQSSDHPDDHNKTSLALAAIVTKVDEVEAAVGSGGTPPDATTTVKGIVELATTAESQTGTDTTRASTPSGVNAAVLTILAANPATTSKAGIVELATNAETTTGTDAVRAVTPAGLAAVIAALPPGGGGGWTAVDASTTVKGIVELATDAETTTGTDTVRAVTPSNVAAALIAQRAADAAGKGIVELATNAETITGTDAARAVTPAGLTAALAPVLAPKSNVNDALWLTHLERRTRQKLDTCNRRVMARAQDATIITESWSTAVTAASPPGWGGTATVAANKMFNSAGALNRDISAIGGAGKRVLARAIVTIPASSTKYTYFGFSNDAAGATPGAGGPNAFMLGINSLAWGVLKGTNVTGTVSNTPAGAVAAGTYMFTAIADEENISLSAVDQATGLVVASTSILRSQMPSGPALNNVIISNNDTTNATYWGPLVIVSDIMPPPVAQQTINGTNLFGASNPIHFSRRDPVTGIRHVGMIPGTYDPRVPSPVVEVLHWALTATAATLYSDARWQGITAALLGAGYIIVTSDNGPATTPGGSQDNYGNQTGMDDYAALIEWVRQHFNTGPVMLLGASQGGLFAQNMLASRLPNAVGGIAAVASISPGTDLIPLAANATFTSAILAAWGVASQPALATLLASNGLNPVSHTAAQARGVPQRFYVATDDTTTPQGTHIDPVVAALGASVPEAVVQTGFTGGHLAAGAFQPSDVLAFFNRYAA